jgi:hypothetical protein
MPLLLNANMMNIGGKLCLDCGRCKAFRTTRSLLPRLSLTLVVHVDMYVFWDVTLFMLVLVSLFILLI